MRLRSEKESEVEELVKFCGRLPYSTFVFEEQKNNK